jgi:hypothetical protein
VTQRLTVESVKHCVACSVGGSSTAVCLTALSELERLATESTLVDLAFLRSGERETEMLELFMAIVRQGKIEASTQEQLLLTSITALKTKESDPGELISKSEIQAYLGASRHM